MVELKVYHKIKAGYSYWIKWDDDDTWVSFSESINTRNYYFKSIMELKNHIDRLLYQEDKFKWNGVVISSTDQLEDCLDFYEFTFDPDLDKLIFDIEEKQMKKKIYWVVVGTLLWDKVYWNKWCTVSDSEPDVSKIYSKGIGDRRYKLFIDCCEDLHWEKKSKKLDALPFLEK